MTRSPAASAVVGVTAGLLGLAVLVFEPFAVGAGIPATAPGPVSAPGIDNSAPVGIAAIAAAGIEVRHVMKVAGPDPKVVIQTPAPTPGPAAKGATAGSLDGIAVAWHSGAAGPAATDGSFGDWRGEPLQIVGTWSDSTAQEQTDISSLDKYREWNGDIDIAVGGLAPGDTWSQAASGAYLDRWTQAVRNIRAKRAGRSGTTYVRFAHEMTGDWFDWRVTPGNVGDFKTSWRLFHDLLKHEFPQAKLVFSPNDGNHSGVGMDQIWPGDDLVDVVGPDSYDGYPDKTDQSLWDEAFFSTKDGPQGLGAWQAFARQHGKPMALPEWGLRFSDNPFFITKMHEFLAGCAAKPGDTSLAGKCIYDVYFNIVNNGNAGFVIYGGNNPNAAATYRGLEWGAP